MSSSQSPSKISTDETSPLKRRPTLPAIQPVGSAPPGSKGSSPTSGTMSLPETRSSNVHDLLNHTESQRLASKSPISSHSPQTPNTTLPPVNVLAGFRSYQAPAPVDIKVQPFFGRTSPSMLPRTAFPLRHPSFDDARRGSDASIFSSISPTTSMTSSMDHGRVSPPIHGPPHFPPGSFQFMTSGGLVVPLDTQQGSRLADEKRKRNAGASARFRQRRKEKEKEASHSIQRLEARVKELDDLTGWYRNERDHLRQICISHGLQSQVGPRPASPRLVKMTATASTVTSPSEWQHHGERAGEENRNQRRRIDYFDGAPIPTPAQLVADQASIAHSVHTQQPLSHQVPRVFHASPNTNTIRNPYEMQPQQQQQKQPSMERPYATIR